VAFGYGGKSDYMNLKAANIVPAPNQYEVDIKDSLAYQSLKKVAIARNQHGFYNGYDKYDKICYDGMEKHFYLRETKGPGAYLSQDAQSLKRVNTQISYSVPKRDRGLLTSTPSKSPGPTDYKLTEIQKVMRKSGIFKMPKASRDIPFSKYSSVHQQLISKGIC